MPKKDDIIINGKVFKFGDNVDTDQIIPARFLDTSDPSELAKHCMSGADEEFASKVTKGDIIVAGKDFGCGSSREHAPLSIKASGIGAVVAKSFARIFYRNAINIGLPIVECDDFEAKTGDTIVLNLTAGKIKNESSGKSASFMEFPEFLTEIIEAGGLMNRVKER